MYERLLNVQKTIGAVAKDSTNPFFNSRYFDINALLAAIKPVLNENGFVLLQPLTNVEGKPAVRTLLIDSETGEAVIDTSYPVPEGLDAQKSGGAITYIRRYSVQSALGIEAEDDDGNSASKPTPVSKKGMMTPRSVEYPEPKADLNDVPF